MGKVRDSQLATSGLPQSKNSPTIPVPKAQTRRCISSDYPSRMGWIMIWVKDTVGAEDFCQRRLLRSNSHLDIELPTAQITNMY